MLQTVDKLFINGKIYSMEAEGKCYEALAVKDGKIAFIGDTAAAHASFEADETIDLDGKVMLPGMGDSHLHFFAYCQTFTTVDLGVAKSKAQALELLKAKAAETPEGEWIRGNNFDQSKWSDCEDEIPTRQWLDEASEKHPIVIKRVCLHTGVANTRALEKAGIGIGYDFGDGGLVELEENGYPNGILREQATKIFDGLIPDPTKIPEVKAELMDKALKEASSVGITAIHTFAAEIWKYTEDFDDYLKLDHEGKLPLRVSIYLDTLYTKPYLTKREMEDPFLKVRYGGYKIFSDGSLGSRSAKLFEPYEDAPDTDGMLVLTEDELNESMLKAYEMGLQPATHCIGDKGLDCVLTAIEYTLQKSREHGMTEAEQANREPFRIIHAQMARPDLIERMSKLPVIIDIQPTFLCTDVHWIEERVGAERAANSYQWKTYIEHGLMLLGGSDCPVENFSPWYGIYSAVVRKDLDGYPKNGYHMEEKLSVYDALCMFTKNIPYGTGQEDYLGTLEVGKFADMVVIDRNIFEIPEEDIANIKVENTYLAGNEVYRR
ncbi:MAG: amidohydrolase [Eubacterium sp.]|nr:amidohydrolase [Eubacterium sp.]